MGGGGGLTLRLAAERLTVEPGLDLRNHLVCPLPLELTQQRRLENLRCFQDVKLLHLLFLLPFSSFSSSSESCMCVITPYICYLKAVDVLHSLLLAKMNV